MGWNSIESFPSAKGSQASTLPPDTSPWSPGLVNIAQVYSLISLRPRPQKRLDIMYQTKSQAKMMIHPRWWVFNQSKWPGYIPLKVTFPTIERVTKKHHPKKVTNSQNCQVLVASSRNPLESHFRVRLFFSILLAWEAWIWRKKKTRH